MTTDRLQAFALLVLSENVHVSSGATDSQFDQLAVAILPYSVRSLPST
jgi:hypothetical protein